MTLADQTKKQILVVEDEGLIAADVRKRLERFGYAVPAIAQSGEEALRCARKTAFDLALMDIRIQGEMDGIATAAALKKEFEMPVVYMTAHSDQETVDRARLTEPFGYVLKPVADGNLRSAVQVAIYKSEMDARLRTSEAWLRATLRSVGEGIVATNTNCEVVFMNPVAEQMTGWSSAESQGCQLMDVLGLFDESGGLPAKNPVFELFTGESRRCTVVSRMGGHIDVEVECFENRADEEVLGAIVALRDIRARREMESRLLQSQRMEAVASMAGGLAHEFNNQLMVILGYAEELAGRLTGEDQQDAIEIKDAATLATSISSQMLTLSRGDAGRAEVLNVHDVICEIQPMLSHTLGKGRCLTTGLGSPAGFVRADRNQLKQVLLNLTLNARDAMKSGGEVTVTADTVDIGPDNPDGRLHGAGLYARIQFTDSGEGMDKATLSRIFEPFFTTKTHGHGSGLGLSIVHSTIAKSGGFINASSRPGAGTTFEIFLPCIGTFERTGEGIAHRAQADIPTILLVEDEDGVRKLVHGYLERAGFQLLEAANSETAELIARAYPDTIHLLISDVVMPGLSGPQLAERLAPLRPGMKVLFVSGYRRDCVREFEGRGEAADVLLKPFPAVELLRRVRLLLDDGKVVVQ